MDAYIASFSVAFAHTLEAVHGFIGPHVGRITSLE